MGVLERIREEVGNRAVESRSAVRALAILRHHLGIRRAARVVGQLLAAQVRGEPFGHLGAAGDRREQLSRRQVAPAILLYRAVKDQVDSNRALALVEEVVVSATLDYLGYAIGDLHHQQLADMDSAERETYLRRIGDRFFNATIRWDEISDQRVKMTVTHCTFPGLCRAAAVPELAPLLCRGDAVYFGEVLDNIEFRRAHTLAEGGDSCPFELERIS